MKKLLSACAVLALAIGLVVAPGAIAKKGPKLVPTFVTVNVTPNPVVAGAATTATGNVSATSNCRKFRTVQLDWVNTTTLAVTPPARCRRAPTAITPAPRRLRRRPGPTSSGQRSRGR